MKYPGYRPTWAEIDLGNLAHNFRQLKNRANKCKVLVTVKADAYGHGLIPISEKLVSCGADFLGVASIDEGIKLREAELSAPILVLGPALKKDISPFLQYNLTATVCDEDLASALDSKARAFNKKASVHIKVDTGMGRVGMLYQQAVDFIRKVKRLEFVDIEGLFTHFPLADKDKGFTLNQIAIFNSILADLKRHNIDIPLTHTANSAGAIDYPQSHFNMVRPGLAVYGLYPRMGMRVELKPVLSLKSRIIFMKDVPKGWGISYGHDYITKRDTRIATIPIGYGDGYPRSLSDKAQVLIGGRRFRIRGKICMDQMMLDVEDAPVKTGDEAVLIGSQGGDRISAEELAELAGTIPYEIVCGLGARIPRVYEGV